MKGLSLIAAGSIIVIANIFALTHAARNRVGSPEAEVTLTQRELQYTWRPLSDDDSGVTLTLQGSQYDPNWLDEQKLRRLGFDMNPASANWVRFYERQRPRRAFVALENDGPAWRAWLEAYQSNYSADNVLFRSHLVAIDADLNSGELRARNPDRTRVMILPAVVAISLDKFPLPERSPAKVRGSIRELPSSIHVPRPFSDEFHRLAQQRIGAADKNLSYRIHLRYGRSLEPMVTGVEFTK